MNLTQKLPKHYILQHEMWNVAYFHMLYLSLWRLCLLFYVFAVCVKDISEDAVTKKNKIKNWVWDIRTFKKSTAIGNKLIKNMIKYLPKIFQIFQQYSLWNVKISFNHSSNFIFLTRTLNVPASIPLYFLPCDRWQQRGNLTKCNLTWKYIWSKVAL